jgi:hypothetical protein
LENDRLYFRTIDKGILIDSDDACGNNQFLDVVQSVILKGSLANDLYFLGNGDRALGTKVTQQI